MHRLLRVRSVYQSNLQCFYNGSTNYEVMLRPYYCMYCRNTWKNHVFWDNSYIRFQSTHPAFLRKLSRKKGKIKNSRKYVELLEVNDKTMTETQASVSKLNAKHISQLIANNEVSLSELHKLKLPKKKQEILQIGNIDNDLHKEIEDVVLKKYKQNELIDLKEDDCAIIFASHNVPNVALLQTPQGVKSIKDSYDKFRRETVRKQKMKDIVIAINEGLHQYQSTTDSMSQNTNTSDRVKTRQENFKELLLAMKHSEYKTSNHYDYQNVFHDLEGKGVHFPAALDLIDNDIGEDVPRVKKVDQKVDTHIATVKASELISSVQSKKKKNKKNPKVNPVIEAKEFQLKAKEYSLNKLLACHLDVCINTGNLDKGYRIFNFFRRRGQKNDNHPTLKNIDLFNILLRGYAAQGDYATVMDILDTINSDNLQLNIESYAAIFECIDKSTTTTDKDALLTNYKHKMENEGLSLNDLVDKAHNSKEQLKHVLSAIKSIQPTFRPQYEKSNMDYDCELVNGLNPSILFNKSNINKYTSPAEGLLSYEELIKQARTQMENEEQGVIHIKNIMYEGKPTDSVLYCRQKLKEWEEETKKNLHKAFARNMIALKSQSNASPNPLNILPYLSLLEVEDFVEIMMSHIKTLAGGSESFSQTTRSLQKELGKKVNMQYKILKKKREGVSSRLLELYKQYCDWYLNRGDNICGEKFNSRRAWEQIIHNNRDGTSLNIRNATWPVSVCVCVGKFLHNIIMNDVHVDCNIFKQNAKKKKLFPALYSVYRAHGYIRKNEVKPHPTLVKLVVGSACPTLTMETSLVPSCCPPLPWTSPTKGGYLISETPVIRIIMGSVQQLKMLETASPQSLYPSLDSLNQLGSIPWQINKPILDLMINIFRNGGSKDLNVACPSNALPSPPPVKGSLSKKEKSLAHRLRAQVARQKQEMHSLWCDLLYKLSLANHHRNKIFWLPHNMDFRGRTYPCPPHLSHLGSDISRAIMMFAKGMPLGPNGLKWLKIHCINLTGTMKKCTIDERLSYADSIIHKILDSADKPLDGEGWWIQSEDPWQTLACCKEIANALRSPNHQEYICHIPVHQDGSCNGLQHYAALGRDEAGAYSVNLSAADRPQDVYSAVVNLVEASRIQDAANGVQIAAILEGFVKRKVIKQTIMTTVYGVTKFGARLQIAKQLKDVDNFPKEHVWAASFYLTRKTFESLTEMFTSTKEIQDWFTACARLISSVRGAKTEWITPLGLPIVQPYHKASKVSFNSRDTLMEYASYDENEKPCTMKQKNAFPPNFIHSLDACHMMLTSLHCESNDTTFVSVHDCFWTHASTVELMNQICREQFVALHLQPILENLSQYLYDKYSTSHHNDDASYDGLIKLLKDLPERGKFDLRNVLKSVYFFS